MLKRIFPLILVFTALTTSLSAQTLSGVIKNPQGEPVSGATLFIQSLGLGIVATSDGSFATNVSPGNYSCEFRCMGYETITKEIEVGEGNIFVDIIMPVAPYMIQEIRVGNRNEDPAYYIVRRAIAMAPYYRSYIKEYAYEAQQKGALKIEKIPSILSRSTINDVNVKELLGETFVIESIADVSFSAPNNYSLHLKAYNTSIPSNMGIDSSRFSINDESIYNNKLYGLVSPLAPNALQYYNYAYIEGRQEGEYWVSKIRIVPKRKSAELFEGYLYINEDTWNVAHFDFSQSVMGVSIRIRQYFNQIRQDVFVPTGESTDFTISVLGVKAEGGYNIARRYESVEVDTLLSIPSMISLPKREEEERAVVEVAPKSKNEQKIQEMIEKESLSNREAYKLAQLMQKTAEENSPKEKKSLEIKRDGDMNITRSTDTLATIRDSIYWNSRRILPLSEVEKRSYIVGDSLRAILHSDSSSAQKSKRSLSSVWSWIILDGDIKLFDNKKWSLYAGGLSAIVREYNFVDGIWLGETFSLRGKLSDKASIFLMPAIHYTTVRKEVTWETTAGLTYAPLRQGTLSITVGDRAEDFNRSYGALRAENSSSSLYDGDPYIHFYRNRYTGVANAIDLTNGLKITLSAEYSDRSAMDYLTTYSIFRNESIRTNTPDSPLFATLGMDASHRLQSTITIDYTPLHYYRVLDNGRKRYSHSTYPTFRLSYQKGWKIDDTHKNPEFDRMDFTITQKIDLGLFNNIRYSLNTGKFFNKRNLSFADVRHFLTNPMSVTAKDMSGFQLLDNYTYSTDQYWGQAEIDYTSAYLLIKNLPFLQSMLFDEALHFRYLYTPAKPHYWEAGYSIGLDTVLRIGIFTSWDRFTYRGIGFSANISLGPNWLR